MKKLFTLLVIILSFSTVEASHIAGGEIWYEHQSGNTYEISMRIYADCAGVNLGTTANINVSSISQSASLTTSLSLASGPTILNSTCNPTTCNNFISTIPGYRYAEFTGTFTFPSQATDWIMSYENCCRNGGITNLVAPNAYVFRIQTTLNNSNASINNSVVATAPIPLMYSTNTSSIINLAPIDLDGDSLDIQFTTPMQNGASSVTFGAGYTASQPFGTSIPTTLDPVSGNLTFGSVLNQGMYVFAVNIDEYRNGVLIASSQRDYQFLFMNGPANALPTLSGVNNSTNYYTTIVACPNSSLSFTVNSADTDAMDSTAIFANNLASFPGATFTVNNAQNQIGTFTWTPSVANVQNTPYVLSLNVKDNKCTFGQQSYGYLIYVTACTPDSVWPGDANSDLICDMNDALSVGVASASSGPSRANASTTWQAQWCANWTSSFINNINYKHADCNGDGAVDVNDLNSIILNFGQTHLKTEQVGQYKTAGFPDLKADVSGVQAYQGSTVSIPIMLGSAGSEVNDFYGIAANVELINAATSAPISMNHSTSWIGNASNSFFLSKELQNNKLAFSIVRNDQTPLNNQLGQIATIDFPIDPNSIPGTQITVQFSDIKMIDELGNEISDFNVINESFNILTPTSVVELDESKQISIYPNPSSDVLNVVFDLNEEALIQMDVINALGEVVLKNVFNAKLPAQKEEMKMDISSLSAGSYFLRVGQDSEIKTIPFQKR